MNATADRRRAFGANDMRDPAANRTIASSTPTAMREGEIAGSDRRTPRAETGAHFEPFTVPGGKLANPGRFE